MLTFFNSEEGYIEPIIDNEVGENRITGFEYTYQYKDHLGNIRLSYHDMDGDGQIEPSTEIKEENHYYPFGLKHKGYNNQIIGRDHNYGYNGKEENDELGLEWLDLGARNHDPTLGRFMNIDPRAEEYNYQSIYAVAENNPVYYIDYNGEGTSQNFDDYGIDKNGHVHLIEKTDDNFDRLYKAESDENGNAVRDENGNTQKVIEGEGTENKDYVKVDKDSANDSTILTELTSDGRFGERGTQVNYATTSNKEDAFKVFQFAAEVSGVEWSLQSHTIGGENTYVLGTYHREGRSPNFSSKYFNLGLSYRNMNYDIHSHNATAGPSGPDLRHSQTKHRYRYIYFGSNNRRGRKGTLYIYGRRYIRKGENKGRHKIGKLYKLKYFKD